MVALTRLSSGLTGLRPIREMPLNVAVTLSTILPLLFLSRISGTINWISFHDSNSDGSDCAGTAAAHPSSNAESINDRRIFTLIGQRPPGVRWACNNFVTLMLQHYPKIAARREQKSRDPLSRVLVANRANPLKYIEKLP